MPKHWVTPSNWVTQLAALPNDGLDYEIVFDPGRYPLDEVPNGAIYIDHSAGGQLNIRPHVVGQTIFTWTRPVVGSPSFYFIGRDVNVHDFVFELLPYYTVMSGAPAPSMFFGGMDDFGVMRCQPTSISIRNITITGSHIGLFATPSNSPLTRTQVIWQNITAIDNAGNGTLVTFGNTDSGFYDGGVNADIFYDNVLTDCRNGPDSDVWVPGNPHSSSHADGTLGIDLLRLAHDSTLTITRLSAWSRILGSLNHDMHCFRLNFLNDPAVRVTIRDCEFHGIYSDGHLNFNGGGNLWMGYYHPGGQTYLTEGARPRIDFENCLFDTTITSGADDTPAGLIGAQDLMFDCGSDADYHFWDCRFQSNVPAAWRPPAWLGHADIFLNGPNTSVWMHNSTWSGLGNTNALGAGQRLYTDTLSRVNPGLYWQRVPTL